MDFTPFDFSLDYRQMVFDFKRFLLSPAVGHATALLIITVGVIGFILFLRIINQNPEK